ncbi:MAG: nucleoside triphosphate pyrophosphohydrolase [Patescibacteria group bacterium]
MRVYNKLVRDKIPEYIASLGQKSQARILNNQEYRRELYKKLQEEVSELLANRANGRREITNELADILEVLTAISKLEKISPMQIKKQQDKKKKERGGFSKRIFLIRS